MPAGASIPSFDLTRNYKRIEHEIAEAIGSVLHSQQFILGDDVARFEAEAANYLGVPHAVSCASGTDALVLALVALGVGPGDEVIVPTFSFFATASCVSRVGATPIFVDVRPDSFCMDMEQAIAAVGPRTKVIIPVHIFGQMAEVEKLIPVCMRSGAVVLEDCAQAFGAHRIHGGRLKRAGAWGEISAFSFFPTKNLGAYGDAGMVAAQRDDIAERIMVLRVHGARTAYLHEEIGMNSRMDSLQAAILRARSRHVEEWTEERREKARTYDLLFAELGLDEFVVRPIETEGNRHTYHQYVIKARDRDGLQKHLEADGIGSRVYYPLPLHLQPCYAHLGMRRGSLEQAEKLCEDVLALPMFPELTEQEQQRVADSMLAFYKKG